MRRWDSTVSETLPQQHTLITPTGGADGTRDHRHEQEPYHTRHLDNALATTSTPRLDTNAGGAVHKLRDSALRHSPATMSSAYGGRRGSARESTPEVLPASQYLQDKLQERRARNTRPKRARQSDFGPRRSGRDDDIFLDEVEEARTSRMFDSSPIASGSRVGSDAGGNGRRRVVYSKDFDEQMDRLTKQNFALKLELDHRRGNTTRLQEQIDEMRAQVERAEQLEDEHTELLRINTQLVEELEKRDKAVEEAMDIICELEDKVTDLEERRSYTRPSTANADSGYAGTETQEQVPPSSPPEMRRAPKTPAVNQRQPPPAASAAAGRLIDAMNRKTPGRLKREPSVMSQKKSSTHALRSVYLENAQSLHPVKSFRSLLSRQESAVEEEDDEAVLNSPRLSVLSESSFPSLYSPRKHLSPERFDWEDGVEDPSVASAHLRQDSIKRVSQWMDEHDEQDGTPSKSNTLSSPSKLAQQLERDLQVSPSKRPGDDERYQSLADALSTASTAAPRSPHEMLAPKSFSSKPRSRPQHLKTESRPTSFAGPIFGSPLLPPTPDSASTRMLRTSHSSIAADDRSLLDNTPAPVKSYAALQPNPAFRTAPKQMRSSIELKTAYQSYVQRENDEALSSDEEDDEGPHDLDSFARNLGVRSGDFPDGNSILFGTPSRFLKGPKHPQPAGRSVMFDGNDLSPPRNDRLQRRQSSSDATVSPRKPSLSRAETSPTFLGPIATSLDHGAYLVSSGSVTSPRSYHSGSSSNRTVVTHQDERAQHYATLSPTLSPTDGRTSASMTSPPRHRKSPSPARTLGQKTQRLFRRMSNSTKETPPRTSTARDPSPLPTLTSTPSSAYINTIPKQARRPSSSAGGDITRPSPHPHRPSTSSRTPVTTTAAAIVGGNTRSTSNDRRPSMQFRTKTEPAYDPGRRTSAAGSEGTPVGQRINPFKRSNSVKTPGPPLSGQRPGTAEKEGEKEGASGKGMAKRRGSIRDAVASAGRRPWR